MILLLALAACSPSGIVLSDDTAAVVDISPGQSDTASGDTAPARPCAFIDDWKSDMQLPTMTDYRYDLTGCGVMYGCFCDDSTIADVQTVASGWLDQSQGAVTLQVSAWVAGSTTCQCKVMDTDYPAYAAYYAVNVESTE